MLKSSGRNVVKTWFGTVAVWLSGISALVYFFTSYGVKNHVLFLSGSFTKVLEKLPELFR
jgi:hypothetical protein